MNSGITSERVYDGLKRRLLSGLIAPGERLEPARFAEELASSVTPVRDALNRLVGERLAETRASDGFHLPLVTEAHLRDLYRWNAALLRSATRDWSQRDDGLRADALAAEPPNMIAALFTLIGMRSANREYAVQIASCNDRLAAIRNAENRTLADIEPEIRAMAIAFDRKPAAIMFKLVRAYHRRRIAAAPDIVRARYALAANNRSTSSL